jgi:hypothetical protein
MYIATLGAIGFIIDTTRIITYISHGITLSKNLFYGLFLFIPASFFGAYIGKVIVEKIPQTHFRTVITLFILIMGIKLLFWS